MQETQVQFLGGEDPLEEGIATHSSILAWKIPWTEEPGRLWSMGSQRVGHGLEISTYTQISALHGYLRHAFRKEKLLNPFLRGISRHGYSPIHLWILFSIIWLANNQSSNIRELSTTKTGKRFLPKAEAIYPCWADLSATRRWVAGTPLTVHWLRIRLPMQGTRGSIPGQGDKLPHPVKQRNLCATARVPGGHNEDPSCWSQEPSWGRAGTWARLKASS